MVKTRDGSSGTGSKRQGGWHDQQWNAKYSELVKYKAEHGDCNVPKKQGSLDDW